MFRFKIFVLFMLFSSQLILAKERKNTSQELMIRSAKYFDINRISCSIQNNAVFARHPISGNSDFFLDGFYYIYSSGLWIGAKVNGEVRASAADFNTDFAGGIIKETGIPFGIDDSTFRVYKISKGDNAFNNIDYATWPAQYGAPINANGEPLIIGNQTLWSTFTDAFEAQRGWYNICPPLGAEVHLTVWGWEHIDDIMFLRWEIINKSSSVWEDAYFGIWSDPDVFDANDDLVGSDSTLSLVYCYDVEKWDKTAKRVVGYQVLESPIIQVVGDTAWTFEGKKMNFKNLPINSPRIDKHSFPNWEGWGEPRYSNEETTQMVYNRLMCLNFDGEPAIDPVTNQQSYWAFSGDPVLKTGWNDSIPRDRRMLLSTGGIEVQPEDTCAITTAILPIERDRTERSVFDLKNKAAGVRSFFRYGLGLFTQEEATVPGEERNRFAIQCLNNVEAQSISFIITSNSKDILLTDVFVSDRTQNFHLVKQFDPDHNQIKVELNGEQNMLPAGQGAIAEVIFDVEDEVDSQYVDVHISEISFTRADGMAWQIESSKGIIKIKKPLKPARLISPENNSAVDGMTINFSWHGTADTNEMAYFLDFLKDDSRLDRTVNGTNYRFNIIDFVSRDSLPPYLDWTVNIMDLIPTSSPDTFRCTFPPMEKVMLTTPQLILTLPAIENYYQQIVDYVVKYPYLYIIEKRMDNMNFEETYLLHVAQIKNDEVTIIHTQPIEYDEYGKFKVSENRAFIYTDTFPDRKLSVYNITDEQHFQLVNEHPMNHRPQIIGLYEDLLLYVTVSRIILIQVNSDDSLTELAEYDISTWENFYGYYESMIDIKNGLLFLAGRDVGIFDIRQPDTISLVYRFKTNHPASAVYFENDKLYVGSLSNSISIYDVSSVENPRLIYQEQFVDNRRGTSAIFSLKVIDEHIFFQSGSSKHLQACHYEPNRYFVFDLMSLYSDHYVTANKVYCIEDYGRTSLCIFDNKVFTGIKENQPYCADTFSLLQNYPNPFNASTKIQFNVEKSGHVNLKIFNTRGQFVKQLIDQNYLSGQYSISWDGTDQFNQSVCSGVYFAKLSTADKVRFIKMLIIR